MIHEKQTTPEANIKISMAILNLRNFLTQDIAHLQASKTGAHDKSILTATNLEMTCEPSNYFKCAFIIENEDTKWSINTFKEALIKNNQHFL